MPGKEGSYVTEYGTIAVSLGTRDGRGPGHPFAPEEGSKTRERIAEEARRLGEKYEGAEGKIREKADDLVRSVREVALAGGEIFQEGRERILATIEETENAITGLKERIFQS